jgi:hypothetical protein
LKATLLCKLWFRQRKTRFWGHRDEEGRVEIRDVRSIKLSELRGEPELSLDEFCTRNMDIFESKLAFHTQQLQEAIARSVQFVVRTPHDRLLDEVPPFGVPFFISLTDCIFSFDQDRRELYMERNGEFRDG